MRYVGFAKEGRPTAKPHVVRETVFAQPGLVCAERVEAVRANVGGSGASKVLGLDSALVQERSFRGASFVINNEVHRRRVEFCIWN